MPTSALRKVLYRAGLLTPFWKVDRTRYLKRLAKRKAGDWRYVAKDDAAQFGGNEVVARLMGVSAPVFFYCDRNSYSIEADILKSAKVESGALKQRWRVLELGMDLISPGNRVIDVGANIGVYALPWAAMNADVTVHCFEPNPAVRARHDLYLSASETNERKTDLSKLLSRLGYETLYISRWGSDLLAVADWSRRLNGDLLALPLDGQAQKAP